jgi:hypothetical protein
MLQTKKHAPTPHSVVSTFRLIVESIKELRGASHTFTKGSFELISGKELIIAQFI